MPAPWLQTMTWEEVSAHLEGDDVIIVPIGSVEQHGRHLPLGTDSMVAISLAGDAALAAGALAAPPLWYGWSPHHMGYAGSVTLKPETIITLVSEVVESLVHHGFGRVILLNGHRIANLAPLSIAATRLHDRTGAYVAVADPYEIGTRIGQELRESGPGGLGHADELETAHMLHIHPELTDMTKAVANMPDLGRFSYFHLQDPTVDLDRVFLPATAEEFAARTAPTGVSGDALPATEEKGRRFHEAVVENLAALVGEARKAEVELKEFRFPV